MTPLSIALGSLVLYLIAYHTYGRWLARKIFRLDPEAPMPSVARSDAATAKTRGAERSAITQHALMLFYSAHIKICQPSECQRDQLK